MPLGADAVPARTADARPQRYGKERRRGGGSTLDAAAHSGLGCRFLPIGAKPSLILGNAGQRSVSRPDVVLKPAVLASNGLCARTLRDVAPDVAPNLIEAIKGLPFMTLTI